MIILLKRLLFYLLFVVLLFPFLNVNASVDLNIDYPTDNLVFGNRMYVQGWSLSDNVNTKLVILVDNHLISDELEKYARLDLIPYFDQNNEYKDSNGNI